MFHPKSLRLLMQFTFLVTMMPGICMASNTITLGVAGPHTGPLAAYGLPTVNAAKLVAKEFNARGGVLGKRVELVIKDDQCKPAIAAEVASGFVANGVDVVLGHICSGTSKAAMAVYQNAGIIAMSPSSTNPALTQSGKFSYFFRTIAPDNAQPKLMVAYAVQKLGASKIAIVHDKGDYGKGLAEFAKEFIERDSRATLVLYSGVTPGAAEYSTIVSKIRRSGADVVIYGGYHPEASKIVRGMRKKRMKTPFISDDGVKDPAFIKSAGRYADGVYATGPIDISNNPLGIRAVKAHKRTFHGDPGAFFHNAYAAAVALLTAIEKAGSTDGSRVSRVLKSDTFDTPIGQIQFNARGDVLHAGFAMYRVQNKKFIAMTKPSATTPNVAQVPPTRPQVKPQRPRPRDTTPPVIRISSHAITRGLKIVETGKRTVISGRAIDASGVVEVMVNNVDADLDENGNFSAQILLKPGQNTIAVAAIDTHNNRAAESFVMHRQSPTARNDTGRPPPPIATTAGGTYYALVIGINNYKHLPKLKTAINDAREVGSVLKTDYGFNTRVLLDPNRRTILRVINDFRKILRKNDHFLVYYAGHGEFDRTAQKAYWLPVDAAGDNDIDWIIVDTLTSNMKRIAANHILVVADSCYSGTLTRSTITNLGSDAKRERYINKMSRKSSRTLMASGGNEPVADGGGRGHSIFALAFIEGLRDMDYRTFTAEELYFEHVKERVAGNADQTPEYNTIRNSGHSGGDFIFSRAR